MIAQKGDLGYKPGKKKALVTAAPKGLSLYELTAELVPLEQALEATGGDVTGQDALVERVTELLDKVASKVDGYIKFYQNLLARAALFKAQEDIFKAEVARLAGLRKALENKAERLKEAAKTSMEARSIVKLEGSLGSIAVQPNGGQPAIKVLVKDPKDLPAIYRKVTVEADLDEIRKGLDAKDPQLVGKAELLPVGTHVRIR